MITLLSSLLVTCMFLTALVTAWGGTQLLLTKLDWERYGEKQGITTFVQRHVSPITAGTMVLTAGSVSGLLLTWLGYEKVGLEYNAVLTLLAYACPGLTTGLSIGTLIVIKQRNSKQEAKSERVIFDYWVRGKLAILLHIAWAGNLITTCIMCLQAISRY